MLAVPGVGNNSNCTRREKNTIGVINCSAWTIRVALATMWLFEPPILVFHAMIINPRSV
jgi:hypothetical protein